MATLWRTTSGVSVWPLPTIAMSSETTRSASATSAGSPDRVSALPRTCRSAARMRSSARRFSSAEPSRPTTRSGGTLMLLRTSDVAADESAFVSRGVTWGFVPAFCVSAGRSCSGAPSLPPGSATAQWLTPAGAGALSTGRSLPPTTGCSSVRRPHPFRSRSRISPPVGSGKPWVHTRPVRRCRRSRRPRRTRGRRTRRSRITASPTYSPPDCQASPTAESARPAHPARRPRRSRSATPSGPSHRVSRRLPTASAISSSAMPPSGPTINITESACARE